MIDEIKAKTNSSLRLICETLQLPRSSYYHAAEPTKTALGHQSLGELIEEIFKRHRRRYGHRRIWEELRKGVQKSVAPHIPTFVGMSLSVTVRSGHPHGCGATARTPFPGGRGVPTLRGLPADLLVLR